MSKVLPQGLISLWRKAQRERLIAARLALSVEYRTALASAIAEQLSDLISVAANPIVSVYWPIRAEPDLRPWMLRMWERGARIALPVAVALRQPLRFREWHPNATLARGLWKIPYPADGAEVIPSVVLAPVIGFDPECFRLGYGGGFFDRTLAAMHADRLVIGLGYPSAAIPTIYPQSHDIPMDYIVTGTTALKRQGNNAIPRPSSC